LPVRSTALVWQRKVCIASPKSNQGLCSIGSRLDLLKDFQRKLARAMLPGSFPFATAPQRFPADRLGFSASLVGAYGFVMVGSVRGSGAAPFRIGLEPGEDLLPFTLKGVLVGATPAQHAFSPLLLAVQGLESRCWSGSIPLFRKISRCTLFYRQDVERVGKGE